MLKHLKKWFLRLDRKQSGIPPKVFVIYAHASDPGPDDSVRPDSFDPPFFPSDKVGQFTAEEFSGMAKVFRRADQAIAHLYRCRQPDMVPCAVYALSAGHWIYDESATDFFHENDINY